MNALAAVHLVCAASALLCSGVLVGAAVRRRSDRFPFAVYAVGTLAAASWAGHVAWYELAGQSAGQVFWLPSVGLSAAAALFWTRLVVQPGWSPRLGWIAVAAAEPLAVLAIRLLLGDEALVLRDGGAVRIGWAFGVHSAYCFVLLVATVVFAGSRWNDATAEVRLAMRVLAVGAISAILAEALRLQLTDVVVVVTMVVVAGAALSAPPGAFAPRPAPGLLVDHVGALVLVLDGAGRLLDLNAPARAFCASHGVRPPTVGSDLSGTLGVLLGAPATDAPLELDIAGTRVTMHGHAERIGAGSATASWVVVLRHQLAAAGVSDYVAADDDADHGELAEELVRLSEQGEPAADVVAMGLQFIRPDDATRAANALRYVAGSLEAAVVALGVVDSRTVVAVAPRHLEGLLADVASGWWGPGLSAGAGNGGRGDVQVVSFAPALAQRPLVRHGRADGATDLVSSIRKQLAAPPD